jgi:precorrin isomerase
MTGFLREDDTIASQDRQENEQLIEILAVQDVAHYQLLRLRHNATNKAATAVRSEVPRVADSFMAADCAVQMPYLLACCKRVHLHNIKAATVPTNERASIPVLSLRRI